jgi:hypothetical protein
MPFTEKGKEIMKNMKEKYGKDAEQVFYASRNAGTISGVEKARKIADGVKGKKNG